MISIVLSLHIYLHTNQLNTSLPSMLRLNVCLDYVNDHGKNQQFALLDVQYKFMIYLCGTIVTELT